jgi:membrane protease subunit (stomatin/prohibitin family)
MGIGISATSKAINENKDEFGNVISTTTGMVMGATADALRTHKDDLKDMADVGAYASHDAIKSTARAMKEGFKDTMFCKHCGAEIDRDSKFCSECGGAQ